MPWYEAARARSSQPAVAVLSLAELYDIRIADSKLTAEAGAPLHRVVNNQVADDALNLLNVDRFGLDEMDRRIMLTIIDKFQGGPIGLETLATVVCEEKNTLEDVYEPFLIQSGFLTRTPRGRVATANAFEHFGRKMSRPGMNQPTLFDQS